MARPKSPNPRSDTLRVRVRPSARAALTAIAEKEGVTLSEAHRRVMEAGLRALNESPKA